jgi:hypothetical protein
MSPYGKAWLAWGAAALASFAVIETKALLSDVPDATLSANLRNVFGFQHEDFGAIVRQHAFYAGVGWLTWHIARPLGQQMHHVHRQM